MWKEYKILLAGFLAVVLLDTVGSITSKQLDYNYGLLFPLSLLLYGTVAYLLTGVTKVSKGVLFAVLMGLFDGTVGLAISTYLEANTGLEYEMTPTYWVTMVILNSIFAALVGWISGRLARWANRNRTSAQPST